jgi:hypothetical protein
VPTETCSLPGITILKDEGLRVDLRDAKQSSAQLSDLNTFGAELEVFYIDG